MSAGELAAFGELIADLLLVLCLGAVAGGTIAGGFLALQWRQHRRHRRRAAWELRR